MTPTQTTESQQPFRILHRVLVFEERKAQGESIDPIEERMLRMDLRECIGVTGEGIPWVTESLVCDRPHCDSVGECDCDPVGEELGETVEQATGIILRFARGGSPKDDAIQFLRRHAPSEAF